MTKVKVKVEQELDLDWESIQAIVVATLKEDFDAFSNDIQRLRMEAAHSELKPYQREDLSDWMTTRDAIYNVLRWYTTPDELDSFMRNRSLL